MSDTFDVTLYTRAPLLNVASAIGLGASLLAALPKKPEAKVHKAAKRLRNALVTLQTAWGDNEKVAKKEDPRPADQALDNGWGSVFARLETYARLPAERHPKAMRAGELLGTLFPTGLTFLTLPYAEEWAESNKRLDRIAADGLDKELDLFVGKEFLAEVRTAHTRYGDMIGATRPRAAAADPAQLAEPLRRVAEAVVHYATQVVATYDPDEPATAGNVRASLAPIDELRSAQAARRMPAGASGSQAPSPAMTLPALPPNT